MKYLHKHTSFIPQITVTNFLYFNTRFSNLKSHTKMFIKGVNHDAIIFKNIH